MPRLKAERAGNKMKRMLMPTMKQLKNLSPSSIGNLLPWGQRWTQPEEMEPPVVYVKAIPSLQQQETDLEESMYTSASTTTSCSSSLSGPPQQRQPRLPLPDPGSTTSAIDSDTILKRVRFGHVYELRYLDVLTKKQVKELWYSSSEIEATRVQHYALNLNIAVGHWEDLESKYRQKDNEQWVWRGLEHIRQGQLMCKMQHRQNFVRAFLYFHSELGVNNPEALQVFAANNSLADREAAVKLGSQDAVEAFQLYQQFLSEEQNRRNRKLKKTKGWSRPQHPLRASWYDKEKR